ncbi:hypothetical protein B0H15DRAFT_602072 [Mycena belliarum]|uniref:Uncharacterized protein n=1 Tax=Mycena belliarum TaxID=1033014 RepID=A0AAD6TQQ6_9AGAR|nr:hypothetical protein B0H15DRAFT_602072 [Mycena belliae]
MPHLDLKGEHTSVYLHFRSDATEMPLSPLLGCISRPLLASSKLHAPSCPCPPLPHLSYVLRTPPAERCAPVSSHAQPTHLKPAAIAARRILRRTPPPPRNRRLPPPARIDRGPARAPPQARHPPVGRLVVRPPIAHRDRVRSRVSAVRTDPAPRPVRSPGATKSGGSSRAGSESATSREGQSEPSPSALAPASS